MEQLFHIETYIENYGLLILGVFSSEDNAKNGRNVFSEKLLKYGNPFYFVNDEKDIEINIVSSNCCIDDNKSSIFMLQTVDCMYGLYDSYASMLKYVKTYYSSSYKNWKKEDYSTLIHIESFYYNMFTVDEIPSYDLLILDFYNEIIPTYFIDDEMTDENSLISNSKYSSVVKNYLSCMKLVFENHVKLIEKIQVFNDFKNFAHFISEKPSELPTKMDIVQYDYLQFIISIINVRNDVKSSITNNINIVNDPTLSEKFINFANFDLDTYWQDSFTWKKCVKKGNLRKMDKYLSSLLKIFEKKLVF